MASEPAAHQRLAGIKMSQIDVQKQKRKKYKHVGKEFTQILLFIYWNIMIVIILNVLIWMHFLLFRRYFTWDWSQSIWDEFITG